MSVLNLKYKLCAHFNVTHIVDNVKCTRVCGVKRRLSRSLVYPLNATQSSARDTALNVKRYVKRVTRNKV